MKIYPHLTVIAGQKEADRRLTRNKNRDAGETQSVDHSGRKGFEVVSLENKRALAQGPPDDLSRAEALLARTVDRIRSSNRFELANVHRLEGLVHFYQT